MITSSVMIFLQGLLCCIALLYFVLRRNRCHFLNVVRQALSPVSLWPLSVACPGVPFQRNSLKELLEKLVLTYPNTWSKNRAITAAWLYLGRIRLGHL